MLTSSLFDPYFLLAFGGTVDQIQDLGARWCLNAELRLHPLVATFETE